MVCGHQKWVGRGEWSTSIPDPPWYGLSAAQLLMLLPLKVSFSQPVSLASPWSLLRLPTFSFLVSNRLSAVDVTLPFSSP